MLTSVLSTRLSSLLTVAASDVLGIAVIWAEVPSPATEYIGARRLRNLRRHLFHSLLDWHPRYEP